MDRRCGPGDSDAGLAIGTDNIAGGPDHHQIVGRCRRVILIDRDDASSAFRHVKGGIGEGRINRSAGVGHETPKTIGIEALRPLRIGVIPVHVFGGIKSATNHRVGTIGDEPSLVTDGMNRHHLHGSGARRGVGSSDVKQRAPAFTRGGENFIPRDSASSRREELLGKGVADVLRLKIHRGLRGTAGIDLHHMGLQRLGRDRIGHRPTHRDRLHRPRDGGKVVIILPADIGNDGRNGVEAIGEAVPVEIASRVGQYVFGTRLQKNRLWSGPGLGMPLRIGEGIGTRFNDLAHEILRQIAKLGQGFEVKIHRKNEAAVILRLIEIRRTRALRRHIVSTAVTKAVHRVGSSKLTVDMGVSSG